MANHSSIFAVWKAPEDSAGYRSMGLQSGFALVKLISLYENLSSLSQPPLVLHLIFLQHGHVCDMHQPEKINI